MKHCASLKTIAAILLAAGLLVPGIRAEAGHPPSQVLVDVGAASPRGDLGAEFYGDELGLGAADGLELGFRWRFRFSESLSLSPSFHFVNYKDFKSTDPTVGEFRIASSSFRYSLELMWTLGGAATPVRPFAAVSGGVYRNRVEGFYKTFEKPFDESVNTLGAALRAGVLLGGFELSFVYNVNRFDTWRFFDTGYEESYDWDNAGIRVGWIIPFEG